MKGVMLQFISFTTAFIFSRFYARLIFCGDYTLTIDITVCTSWVPLLFLSFFYNDLTLFLCFLPEEVYFFLLDYSSC
jgi:hypothetical protein